MRNRLSLIVLTAAMLTGCDGERGVAAPNAPSLAQGSGSPADIDGVWSYSEEVFLVIKPGDEVLHLRCVSPDGVLTLDQNGSTFTGTLVYSTGSCETKDGQVLPPPWPLPYEAVLSGHIAGRSVHIDQFDAPPAPPVHCPKTGTIEISGEVAVRLTTVGRCDLSSAPFRPALATNSGIATRP